MAIGVIAAGALWLASAAPAGTVNGGVGQLVGADTGGNTVKLFDAAGTPFNFSPFAAGYTGGVRVTLGDVTGDGRADLIVGAGPGGGPAVRVFSGASGALIDSFDAFAPTFTGGVYVGAGDVNGDGFADIVAGSGPASGGTPHVRVFDGRTGVELRSFLAYGAAYAGGVTVAVGDVNGDGRGDIITGAASASAAHEKVFDGVSGAEIRSFFAYDVGFNGGVFVAGGDVNGDARDDLITGPNAGGAPNVKVFSGTDLAPLASFFAYAVGFTGGVRVAAGDVNGDGREDIITAPGPGASANIARFLAPNATPGGSFLAFDAGYTGGAFVAGAITLPTVLRDGFEGN